MYFFGYADPFSTIDTIRREKDLSFWQRFAYFYAAEACAAKNAVVYCPAYSIAYFAE